jgi:hypothetical protein
MTIRNILPKSLHGMHVFQGLVSCSIILSLVDIKMVGERESDPT